MIKNGLMLHDDGDNTFQSSAPGESEQLVRQDMQALMRTAVTTVSYCIGTGVLNYPTKVGSAMGWRRTRYDDNERWGRIARTRAGLQRGEDPIRAAAQTFRAGGGQFLLSHRINDAHFMKQPEAYPLVPEFYLRNRDLIIGKSSSPVANEPDYGNLLDFTHSAVRDYNSTIMAEATARYADVIDGLEIDFMRGPFLFARGVGRKRAHLITSMIGKVRSHLDALAARNGRKYLLVVRVPPTVAASHWAGLDIKKLIANQLVDVIIPAQLMTLSHDQPVSEFVGLAAGTSVKIYPALYSRSNASWPLDATIGQRQISKPVASFGLPHPAAVGAAANYYAQGADGIQLYNWAARPWIRSDWFKTLSSAIATPGSLHSRDMSFAVTPAYYFDFEDTYEPRKRVPLELDPDGEAALRLLVGTDLERHPARRVVMRIGFDREPSALELGLNGKKLIEGPVQATLTGQVSQPVTMRGGVPKRYPAPSAFVHIDIEPASVKTGWNDVRVRTPNRMTVLELKLEVIRTDRKLSRR